ncbi:PREDICTED: cationic amino acid transporter 6, chloroplastic-like isoform X2 [Nicotiana attenuata]|uniref:cationic amino acid transporter 6, chloroplastic-like isoform X2 n=1 Tax=Nicotiana attenuata TaxID=49451 RepID=UPI00090585D1|nr:PREDICTED: cationic amino acid transporter 6, chloroplastic-like isoform X2 [Nicotiana attenuata]
MVFSTYLHSFSKTPQKLKKRMLATWTPDQELNKVRLRSGADMKRKLTWYDLVALGVGGMLGVGVFVTTGPVARKTSGPSVFISYIIAAISALLSSLCYTEFSVDVPVAGGAFSYLRVTFGEFVGYFAGANILMEYVLSNAAVSRSFTEYLSCAFGRNDPNSWRVHAHGLMDGYNMLDFSAVALIIVLTICLCHSTKESSMLNLIPEGASFSAVFQQMGWKWASNVVGAGACLGIVASLLVAMLGQARYLCVIGRARLVPSWFAQVHPTTGTPLNATIVLGICQASIALFTELEIVIEMISIGTLLVFYLVSNALIFRRYVILSKNPPLHTLFFLFLLSCTSFAFSLAWKLKLQWWNLLLFATLTISMTFIFQYLVPLVVVERRPDSWLVPFMPWPATISIFLNVFLMTTLKMVAYKRFGIWAGLITLFYIVYGVHSTYHAEEMEMVVVDNNVNTQQTAKVEIQVI